MCDYIQNYVLPTCDRGCVQDGKNKHTVRCLEDYKALVSAYIDNFSYEVSLSRIEFFIRNFPMNVCRYSRYHQKLSPGGGRPSPCKCKEQMEWELEQVNDALSSFTKETTETPEYSVVLFFKEKKVYIQNIDEEKIGKLVKIDGVWVSERFTFVNANTKAREWEKYRKGWKYIGVLTDYSWLKTGISPGIQNSI